MDNTIFADLVWKSQIGDADALEQLLTETYTPVNYLTTKILRDPQTARQVARESLETIAAKLNSLPDPDEFEKWVCKMTAARCVQAMPLYGQTEADVSDNHWLEALPDGQDLSENESAQVIQHMVDALPERQRLCILLLCCGKLSVSAIAQLTGFSTDTVKESIIRGQTAIQNQLWDLQTRNIQLTGMSSLDGILRRAMYQKSEEDPIPMVYGVLGKEIPVPPDPEKTLIRILTAVLVALIAAILIVGGILVMMLMSKPKTQIVYPTLPTVTADFTVAGSPVEFI